VRRTTRLKQLIDAPDILVMPGVHDALGARLAEAAGFTAVTAGGYGATATLLGQPDSSQLSLTELSEMYSRLCDATTLPLLADADTGFGNVTNVARTVRLYEKAGVAGLFIEDQVFPKRCGHIAGKVIISEDQAVGKYRAAVDTRDRMNPDFVIIARTDAFGAVGGSLQESIRRGRAYADAGVDLVWPELSSPDREPAVAFAKAMRESHPNVPLAFNYSSSFKWHKDANPFTFRELGELGYKFIFITLFAAHAGMYAVWNAMDELVRDQEQAQWRLEKTKDGHPTESHHVMARVSHFQELEKQYIPGSDERIKGSAGYDEKRMH